MSSRLDRPQVRSSGCIQVDRALAIERGWEGAQWPSATGKGTSLALFAERLAAGSTVELLRVTNTPDGA